MTKHAVKAHTECLRNELYEMKSGIRVSVSQGVEVLDMLLKMYQVCPEITTPIFLNLLTDILF